MADTDAAAAVPKAPKERSPSFPFIPVAGAIRRLEQFEAYFGRHPAKASQAGLAWAMKGDSSQAQQTLAAVRSYGFLEYEGSGEARVAKLTDLGRTYLRAQQDSVKAAAVKTAALKPKALAFFFAKWGADRPPDPVCLDTLILEHRYSDASARVFLKVYDETIAYAGLADSDKSEGGDLPPNGDDAGKDADKGADDSKPPKDFSIGQLVQREINGALTFPAPRKVSRVFHDKASGWMVSVEGYNGAFPMSEIIPAVGPAAPAIPAPAAISPESSIIQTKAASPVIEPSSDPIETFLANGRLQINANVGLEGIGKLKKMLDKYEELLKLMN